MQATAEGNDRLVCAVLAAQVAALRDTMDTVATVDLLWRTSDVLSRLSGLVLEFARVDPARSEECSSALAAEAEISRSLNALAFLESQRQDASRQRADCVVTALERLADADVTVTARLSVDDLAELYVSEDQRKVHEAAARQFEVSGTADLRPLGREHHSQQGSDS